MLVGDSGGLILVFPGDLMVRGLELIMALTFIMSVINYSPSNWQQN